MFFLNFMFFFDFIDFPFCECFFFIFLISCIFSTFLIFLFFVAFPAVAAPAQVLPSDSSDVPKCPRRLPGSADVTTSSVTMRGCVTERDFFLSHCGMCVNSQEHGLSQMYMSMQLNSGQNNTQAESKIDTMTAENKMNN